MRSIAEVIQQYGREALKQLPFGEDYRYINSLRFLTQQKEKMTQALSLLSPLTDIDLSQLTESYLQHAIAQSAFNDDMDSDTKADELDASLNQFRALCESFSVNTEKAAKIAELQMEIKKIEDRLSEIHAHFAECFHNANKRTSLWQKNNFESYCAQETESPTPEKFIAYIQKTSERYLPETYLPEMGARFPSSDQQCYFSGLAHFAPYAGSNAPSDRAGIIASRAPQQLAQFHSTSDAPSAEASDLFQFLDMLYSEKATAVLELGGNSNRPNYRSITVGKYETEFDTISNVFMLTNTDEHAQHAVRHIRFGTEDQKPLNLSNDELKQFLEFYHHYQNGVVLVHCDAGVGRTGEVRLLVALLDFLSIDAAAYSDMTAIITNMLNTNSDAEKTTCFFEKLAAHMVERLCQLRQLRYCVETEAQFISVFDQLILLVAMQEGCDEQALARLRMQIFPEQAAPRALHIVQETFTNILGDGIEIEASPQSSQSRCESFSSNKQGESNSKSEPSISRVSPPVAFLSERTAQAAKELPTRLAKDKQKRNENCFFNSRNICTVSPQTEASIERLRDPF